MSYEHRAISKGVGRADELYISAKPLSLMRAPPLRARSAHQPGELAAGKARRLRGRTALCDEKWYRGMTVRLYKKL